MKMTLRQLRDKLNNLTEKQLDSPTFVIDILNETFFEAFDIDIVCDYTDDIIDVVRLNLGRNIDMETPILRSVKVVDKR